MLTSNGSPLKSSPSSDETAPAPGKPVSKRRAMTEIRREDKRMMILRTAAQLFAANGYASTSLEMIAEKVEMHKATLYHYIENKESILYQCLVESFGDLEQVMERMQHREVPVLERLRTFAHHLAKAQNNDFGRCLVLVGSSPLELGPGSKVRQFQKRLDDTVRNLIIEGVANGAIKPCAPSLFSALFFGSLNWVPHWWDENGKYDITQVVDSFMDVMIGGIATGPHR